MMVSPGTMPPPPLLLATAGFVLSGSGKSVTKSSVFCKEKILVMDTVRGTIGTHFLFFSMVNYILQLPENSDAAADQFRVGSLKSPFIIRKSARRNNEYVASVLPQQRDSFRDFIHTLQVPGLHIIETKDPQ